MKGISETTPLERFFKQLIFHIECELVSQAIGCDGLAVNDSRFLVVLLFSPADTCSYEV